MKNFQFSIFNLQKGFTLIELMTALSIFIIVITISMSSILGVFNANRKSKSLKTVMGNLNLTLESMSKEMRYGSNYHCGVSGDLAEPQNCPEGDDLISFLSSEGEQITYRQSGAVIEKEINNDGFVPVTAPEIVIDNLTFYTLGAGTGNTLQPKSLILLRGRSGTGKGESKFILQTLVSQRVPDEEELPPYSYPTPVVAIDVDYLVVGGGGGGGNGPFGGGGGGGNVIASSISIEDNQGVPITIGAGGGVGLGGSSTSFGGITGAGGGAGATSGVGGTGANGGGGSGWTFLGGSNTAGFNGGAGGHDGGGNGGGGGGGGDTQIGTTATGPGGAGGAGRNNNYSGSPVIYGSGGGGGANAYWAAALGGSGAGSGGVADFKDGGNAMVNRGGGGGGAGVNYITLPLGNGTGGLGGSGIVIIRYRTSEHSGATGGSISTQGPYTIHTFINSGTFTP